VFKLTLSFDNGPDPEATPFVLDVLRGRGIKTTFFVIGERLTRPGHRDLARRAHAEGHWIGNHTYSHATPLGHRHEPDAAEMEIGRAQSALGDLAHPRRYFRPNGGGGYLDRRLLSKAALDYLVAGRFTCVLWNAVPGDWREPDAWVERALKACEARAWTLLVLHDLPTGAMRHLKRFLDGVHRLGGEIQQEFPPDCVPVAEGQVVGDIFGYVRPD
jgi:peptidoglycan/xylan/chitin deacetylase (PgdA/CDA1 family)